MYAQNNNIRIGLDFSSAKFADDVITSSSEVFGEYTYDLYLESFVFPSQVSDGLKLGGNYFYHKLYLKYVQFPKNLAGFKGYNDNNAFYCYNPLADSDLKVEIPASVKKLNGAFNYAQSLTEIILNEGLESINTYDFYECKKLTSIEIPGTVTIIEKDAFTNTSSLKKIVLKNGLKTIGEYAFRNAFSDDIEPFEIPATVTKIEAYAFHGAKIKSLKIPETVTSLGEKIVQECNNLELLELNTNSIYYNTLLSSCPALKTLVIGEKVTDIAKITYSVSNFPNLKSVEFKNPKGWKVDGTPVSEDILKDTTKAAEYVKANCTKHWTRN